MDDAVVVAAAGEMAKVLLWCVVAVGMTVTTTMATEELGVGVGEGVMAALSVMLK